MRLGISPADYVIKILILRKLCYKHIISAGNSSFIFVYHCKNNKLKMVKLIVIIQ